MDTFIGDGMIYFISDPNPFIDKFTFDKKHLRGLVSIPKYVGFNEGLSFAKENAEWIYKQVNSFSPLIFIENNSNILFEGRTKSLRLLMMTIMLVLTIILKLKIMLL